MTDAGFFRGTSADQDNRFADKQKKLLKEMNFSPILNTKLNMSKIDIASLKPWIEEKIKQVLEKDDELLSESIYEHLAEKEPDGKNILVLITGFVEQAKASKFVEELWTKLVEIQDNANGVEKQTEDNLINETKKNEDEKSSTVAANNSKSQVSEQQKDSSSKEHDRSSGSSEPRDPPSRSVSKSPGEHKLDEHSRGRPRKRLVDSDDDDDGSDAEKNKSRKSRDTSRSPGGDKASSKSRSASGSESRSRDSSKDSSDRKRHRQTHSGSKSRSRSGSRSYSRSYSRSSTRSPKRRSRSRSRDNIRYRGRRSRSPGFRQRSTSPRFRRGFVPRGPYRGSYGYNNRRQGYPMSLRRRPASPYGHRRRFSPRSPIRRRRSPSFSPRRRHHSPSPYYRRMSRSRSPPPYGPGRHMRSPRPPMHGGPRDMMGHHLPHHDTHRPMVPMPRSPRGLMVDNRGYGDTQVLPRHSPATFINKPHDLAPVLLSPGHMQPGPSVPQSPPSSGRKKHKKDKKHKKHKKSKKHKS